MTLTLVEFTEVSEEVQDSSFSGNNAANSQGGALGVAANSTASISNTTFLNNVAARGAAIYAVNSSVTVDVSVFNFNTARTSGAS